MIYLDNAATTFMFEKAVDVYKKYACQSFFNPSAPYKHAIEISRDIAQVKENLLRKLNASKGTIVFTSGATESNNLAIMGSKRNGKWEYVFTEGEHPSVYNTAKELQQQGFKVHFVGLNKHGQVDLERLAEVVNDKTRLISTMHVSNETGAINDIAKIVAIKNQKAKNALVHVDGVQAFCKINVDLDRLGVDFYTISAHKFHGPKGVGALYVKNPLSLKSIVYGGGQENGLRSGTENVAGIMAMDYAVSQIDIDKNFADVSALKIAMAAQLSVDDKISWIDGGSPYILSVGVKGVNGETLMRALQDEGILVGMGSACSTKKSGNRILESMGFDKEEVKTRIRISFNEFLTVDEVTAAAKKIVAVYNQIWEKVK